MYIIKFQRTILQMVFDLQELFGQDVSEMRSQKPVVGLLDTVDFCPVHKNLGEF